jgi:hypothetical protein
MGSIENDWVAKRNWLRQYSQHPCARAMTPARILGEIRRSGIRRLLGAKGVHQVCNGLILQDR